MHNTGQEVLGADCFFLFFLYFTDGSQENTNEEAPENNPAYTTVYVGNLSHEVIRRMKNKGIKRF